MVTKYHLISYILVFYILSPCGQSTDYPHFLFPFPLAHSTKRQPCVAWLTVFREKSRWKSAQAYRKMNLPYPICKSSSLCSPPAGTAVFIISIGKGSYGGFWLCKLGFIEKNCSSFPLVGKNFCRKNLHSKTPSQTSLCETKTTDPTGRRIKKKSDLREAGKKFSETSTPSPLKSA